MDAERRSRRQGKIIAWRTAARLADQIWYRVQTWPPLAQAGIGLPLIRHCDAIGAAIARGSGPVAGRAKRRTLDAARGSARAVLFRIRRAHARDLLSAAECAAMQLTLSELEALLTTVQWGRGPERNGAEVLSSMLDRGERGLDCNESAQASLRR